MTHRFTNLYAWAIVFAVCGLLLISGCQLADWHDCTNPEKVYRDQARKFGLCEVDRRVGQRELHKFD